MRSSRRSSGLKGVKRDAPPAFRDDLREGLTFIGEMPYQYRGKITDTLYVWNERKPSKWVDRRDIPGLIKAAGVDSLAGEWIDSYKAQLEKRAKAKAERAKAKEEAENGDE